MNDDSNSDDSLAITICAAVSISFAIWLILLFIFDSKWREDYRRIKRLLVALSVSEIIYSIASMGPTKLSRSECNVQATWFTFGLICSFMYTAALSCELSITTTHLKEGRYAQDIHEFRRFILYNVLILSTSAIVCIVANVTEEIDSDDALNSIRCHYSRGNMELYGIGLPTALSIIVVIVASVNSWCNIFKMMQVFMPDTEPNALRLSPTPGTNAPERETIKDLLVNKVSESSMTTMEMLRICYDTFMRLDSYTARTVIRLMATPLIYVTIYLMGLIILISDPQASTSILVALCGVLLLPPVNTCLWIITDVPVMHRHRNLLLHCQYTQEWTGNDPTDSDRESDVEQLYANQYQRTYSDILRNPMTIFSGRSVDNTAITTAASASSNRNLSDASGI